MELPPPPVRETAGTVDSDGAIEGVRAGEEPPLFEVVAALLWREDTPDSRELLAEALYELETKLRDEVGPSVEYHRFFTVLNGLLLEAGRKAETGGRPAAIDVIAAAEGRTRNCLALSLLYLLVAGDFDLPLHMVLTRGHTLVVFDDGLTRDYYETTGGYFYPPSKVRERFFPKGGIPGWCLRPLSTPETAAVILANRALERRQDGISKALSDLETAEEFFPSLPQIRVNRGYVFEQAGRLDEALECYRSALSLDEANPFALNNLASLLVKSGGDLPEAHRAARRALALMPRQKAFLLTLKSVEEAMEEARK